MHIKTFVDITDIYRVSQKKVGLVFRAHFRGLNGLKFFLDNLYIQGVSKKRVT